MDSVFEKFSIHDFFNLIIGGSTFILGLQLIDIPLLAFIMDDITFANNEVLTLILTLLICYIIGFEFQAVGAWVEETKIQPTMTQNFLIDNNIVFMNNNKHEVCRAKARKFFESKGIDTANNEFTKEQCSYFFSYCVYFVQIKGQDNKAEKLRDLKCLSSLWMVCFSILVILGVASIVYQLFQGATIETITIIFIYTSVFFVLAVTNYMVLKKNIRSWIKIILSTYEVYSDLS